MRAMRLCAAAVLMAGVAVAAQPPGGGRGGMQWGGGQGGPAGLLLSKTVQGELKLTEEQTTKLKDWGKGFAEKAKAIREEKLQGVERSEMMQKMGEVQAEVSKAAYKELAEVLKPEQVTRLKQIEVQVAGARAFQMPAVQAALKLTDDQKDKLKDANQAMMQEMMELGQEMGFGPGGKGAKIDPAKMQEFQKKQAGLTKEFMKKVEGMLTADQKTAWKEATGEAIDTAKIQAEMPRPGFPRKKDD